MLTDAAVVLVILERDLPLALVIPTFELPIPTNADYASTLA
jgi:hypothetical protein